MPYAVDPSLNRRKLRLELRRARDKMGMTQRQVADDLEWSLSKLIRIETASVSMSVTDLRAMLQLYGIDDPGLVAELEEAARGSKGTSWWTEFNDVLSAQYTQYLGYESAASSIHSYHPIIIPGHLQTQDYALALLEPRVDEARARRVVDLRMARQERIFETAPVPETSFILDEAALRRQIGSPAVMRNQLEQLVVMGQRPDVTIQVLPFSAGAHYSTLGSFVVLGFKDDTDLLYLEHATGSLTSGNDLDLLARYQECFETISSVALRGEAAVELIERVKEEFSTR
ncbi:XRE family transcriptional regulator [Streptomyces sp. AcH 505]|uniref:helix-turn-helix domain-containing protein n=1 Tax=Streptomyces sp. AcH 505 TaxID=352211 RepID=UPI000591D148|nr:XRE family transcriptional regulator [Streptomyces sp. AcH 505]